MLTKGSRAEASPRTILVTGGAGFIGSHFIELLLQQHGVHIVCVDDFNADYDPQLKTANCAAFAGDCRVTIVKQDFQCESTVFELFNRYEFDSVVHLGALAGVRQSSRQPLEYERTNVGGTLTLLEAASRHSLRRFVFVSSSTVYGEGANVPFYEDGPLGIPLSTYGATKRAAELLALTYWRLHRVPVVCLRPFSVYGPRMRPDLALSVFARAIVAGDPLVLFGDGSFRRDFTHVEDVCRGILAALEVPAVNGETFNLGYGSSIAMRDVLKMLETTMGRIAKIRYEPQAQEDAPETLADTRKAKCLLGFQAQIPFERGVVAYCENLLGSARTGFPPSQPISDFGRRTQLSAPANDADGLL